MKDVIVFGSGGHASVIIDIIEKQGTYRIIGLIDDFKKKGETLLGYKIIGGFEELINLSGVIYGGIAAIGDNFARHEVVGRIKIALPDFKFISPVHPFTSIAKNVIIGEGSVIMPGSVINTGTKIGNHCIINTLSSIDHDNIFRDFSSTAPGVITGGNVDVGEFSALCLGAKIIHGIKIGSHSVVGAGAVAVKDVPAFTVAFGVPAKVIRKRMAGEDYL